MTKTKVITNVTTGRHQATITSPLPFREAVSASQSGGYHEAYTAQTRVGDLWQGWKVDDKGNEIVVTHMQVVKK